MRSDRLEEAAKRIFAMMPFEGPAGAIRPAWIVGGNSEKQDEARRYAVAALSDDTAAPAQSVLSYTEQTTLRLLVDLAWNAVSAVDFSMKKKGGRLVEQEFIDEIEATLLRVECLPEPREPAGTVEKIEYALRRILPDEDFWFDPELLEDPTTPSPQADVAGRWLPIEQADKTIVHQQHFSSINLTIRNSDRYWVRDADGRAYEASWSEGENGRNYWWDWDNESPVDPVEFMPHPLDPRFAATTEGSHNG